jgi:dTDP-4-amino-4,6-dideoxygalactose transaminase
VTGGTRDAAGSAMLVDVPFVDLGAVHATLKQEVLDAFGELIERSEFGLGRTVERFELSLAAFSGVEECVGVSSGLDALRLLLAAAGVEPGDEVIVPAMTFIATFAAVSQLGATPVPVDISESDYNIDPAAAESAIGPRSRCLLPVHLYGQLADMAHIGEIGRRHGLGIVEDACQAHGAGRAGSAPGWGTVGAALSFYPSKNLGAMGDAGAVLTNDHDVAERVRMLRVHGERTKYEHERVGWTARLDAFQAVVLAHKLTKLAEWNAERRAVAAAYSELLDGIGDLILPPTAPESEHVWHLYVIRTAEPTALAGHLRERSVATGRHYPTIPPLTAAYAHLGFGPGAFPKAEQLALTGISLPIFPGMTEAQIDAVAAGVASYFQG